MERQEGYYWVKYEGNFVIAKYTNYQDENLDLGGWFDIIGENDSFYDNDFDHINEVRIKAPGEIPD